MIKYKTDIIKALKNAGYPTTRIRKEKIIAECVLTKIRKQDANITLKTIDTICDILNCEISDIVEFEKVEE